MRVGKGNGEAAQRERGQEGQRAKAKTGLCLLSRWFLGFRRQLILEVPALITQLVDFNRRFHPSGKEKEKQHATELALLWLSSPFLPVRLCDG